LNSEIERIESRLNKSAKTRDKNAELELKLARRRVAVSKSRLTFMQQQSATVCAAEIRKLETEKCLLSNQMACLDSRISYWSELSSNRDAILAAAKIEIDRTQKYLVSLTEPTVEEQHAVNVAKLKALQDSFAGTDATIKDLRMLVGS
jgi:hypothetical protein